MKKDSTKNSAPIAPTSAEPSNAAGSKPQVARPVKGTLVKKTGNAKGATDPYTQAKPARKNILGQLARGNGRMFSSAINRQRPNFKDGSSN